MRPTLTETDPSDYAKATIQLQHRTDHHPQNSGKGSS